MPTKRRGSRARSRPADLARVEPAAAVVAAQPTLLETVNSWIEAVWTRLTEFATKVWEGTKGVAGFARDLGRLSYVWIFGSESEFLQERVRFKARYLAINVEPDELAAAFSAALAR